MKNTKDLYFLCESTQTYANGMNHAVIDRIVYGTNQFDMNNMMINSYLDAVDEIKKSRHMRKQRPSFERNDRTGVISYAWIDNGIGMKKEFLMIRTQDEWDKPAKLFENVTYADKPENASVEEDKIDPLDSTMDLSDDLFAEIDKLDSPADKKASAAASSPLGRTFSDLFPDTDENAHVEVKPEGKKAESTPDTEKPVSEKPVKLLSKETEDKFTKEVNSVIKEAMDAAESKTDGAKSAVVRIPAKSSADKK